MRRMAEEAREMGTATNDALQKQGRMCLHSALLNLHEPSHASCGRANPKSALAWLAVVASVLVAFRVVHPRHLRL